MKTLLNTLAMSLVIIAVSAISVLAKDYPEPPQQMINKLIKEYPDKIYIGAFNGVFGEGKAEEILRDHGLGWPVKEKPPEMTSTEIGYQTANNIIPKGKLIAHLQKSFVMTYKGKVYHCFGAGKRVACFLNE